MRAFTAETASVLDDLDFPAHEHAVVAFQIADELDELVPEVLLHELDVCVLHPFPLFQALSLSFLLFFFLLLVFLFPIRKSRLGHARLGGQHLRLVEALQGNGVALREVHRGCSRCCRRSGRSIAACICCIDWHKFMQASRDQRSATRNHSSAGCKSHDKQRNTHARQCMSPRCRPRQISPNSRRLASNAIYHAASWPPLRPLLTQRRAPPAGLPRRSLASYLARTAAPKPHLLLSRRLAAAENAQRTRSALCGRRCLSLLRCRKQLRGMPPVCARAARFGGVPAQTRGCEIANLWREKSARRRLCSRRRGPRFTSRSAGCGLRALSAPGELARVRGLGGGDSSGRKASRKKQSTWGWVLVFAMRDATADAGIRRGSPRCSCL